MHTHHGAAALAAAALLALALTACDPAPTASGTDTKPAPTTPAGPTSAPKTTARTATLPNLVGKGLQVAQDEAQAAGFRSLTSHDSLGRGRAQVLDRGWKVCTQTPAPGGVIDATTKIDLGAVKIEESCPAAEAPAPTAAAGTMPAIVGKSMKVAREALPSNASITVKDAKQGRMVLQESNWQVCTQDPAGGAQFTGQPVAFSVVKFGESCP
ncbi:PASTA domain-containing protein [Streptomyces sp. NPDC097981]|uniref:PASTA domain-containing protein n=1 Tax=Streptomyces sp. NPDC097981 TaxID=3155428 RepID=UPI003326E6DF